MRAVVVGALWATLHSVGQAQPADEAPRDLPTAPERLRVEVVLGAERQFVSFSATDPVSGGEDVFGERFWTGGIDACAMAVVRPWVDVGGCLGVHVVPGSPRDPELPWIVEDQSLILMGRVTARSTFRPVPWLRLGVDLMYRSYVAAGRESGFEPGLRVGFEFHTMDRLPLFFELAWRAQVLTTRSDSTYPFPSEDGTSWTLVEARDVRYFSLGIQAGGYWSF